MGARRCLGWGGQRCGVLTTASRCASCAARRKADTRAHLTGDWPRISAQVLAAHRAQHGDWCPGLEGYCQPHPCTDLTVDHITERSLADGLRVLCRSTNSALGARRQHQRNRQAPGGGVAT